MGASIADVFESGNIGYTLYCKIPPSGVADSNNSAVFVNYSFRLLCLNTPFTYNHSAIDADGDSLSYELCPSLIGANWTNIKPVPAPPPYESVIPIRIVK